MRSIKESADENIWTYEEGWRTLHNNELHNLYASLNIFRVTKSRRMRLVGHEMRNVFRTLAGKTKRRPSGTPRRREEDNIRTDLREMG
jgi:hypothetical protein